MRKGSMLLALLTALVWLQILDGALDIWERPSAGNPREP